MRRKTKCAFLQINNNNPKTKRAMTKKDYYANLNCFQGGHSHHKWLNPASSESTGYKRE